MKSQLELQFDAGLALLAAKASTHEGVASDAKDIRKDMLELQRRVSWLALDMLAPINDLDRRVSEGEAHALAIAGARGIEGKSLDVYASNGRHMGNHFDVLATYTTAQRGKADALTAARKVYKEAKAESETLALQRTAEGDAEAIAITALGTTPEHFAKVMACKTPADGDGFTAEDVDTFRITYHKSMQQVLQRQAVLVSLAANLAVIDGADPETLRQGLELVTVYVDALTAKAKAKADQDAADVAKAKAANEADAKAAAEFLERNAPPATPTDAEKLAADAEKEAAPARRRA